MKQTLGGRYEIGPELARGGMNTVFSATDRKSGGRVAVKIFDRTQGEIFARQADSLVAVGRTLTGGNYRNLVRIIEVVQDGDLVGMVTEIVDGETLRGYLRRSGKLAPNKALPLFTQVLNGLSELHASGITHRDIKPDNILLDKSGASPVVKISDFDVAETQPGRVPSESDIIIGTPAYLSPEAISGKVVGSPADIYAAGIVLYEMLADRQPFTDFSPTQVLEQHLDKQPPPIEGLHADTSGLWLFLLRLLAKAPEDRPTVDEALAAVGHIERVLPTEDTGFGYDGGYSTAAADARASAPTVASPSAVPDELR